MDVTLPENWRINEMRAAIYRARGEKGRALSQKCNKNGGRGGAIAGRVEVCCVEVCRFCGLCRICRGIN